MPPRSVPTVTAWLAGLSADRRRAAKAVRAVVRAHLPAGYEEAVSGRCLVWQVPLEAYRDTYNGHPLWYAALASEKSYLSLHLMAAYANAAHVRALREGFQAAGKKLDMGKACIRFQSADDLALDAIAAVVASTPMARYIAAAQAVRRK